MDYEMEAKLMNSRLIRIESDLKEVLEMVEHCKTMLRDRNTHTAAVLYGEIIERLKDEVH